MKRAHFYYQPPVVEQVQETEYSGGGIYLEIQLDDKVVSIPSTIAVMVDNVTCSLGQVRGLECLSVGASAIYIPAFGKWDCTAPHMVPHLIAMKDKLPKLVTALGEAILATQAPKKLFRPAGCVDLINNDPIEADQTLPRKPALRVIYQWFEPVLVQTTKPLIKSYGRVWFSWDGGYPSQMIEGKSKDGVLKVKLTCYKNKLRANCIEMAYYGWHCVPDQATEQQVTEAFRDLARQLIPVDYPPGTQHWSVVETVKLELQ